MAILSTTPGCGKKLEKYNFQNTISDQQLKSLCGICQLGSEQICDCYSYLQESVNVFDIVSLCSKCSFRCSPIENTEFTNFNIEQCTNGAQYYEPEYIAQKFSNYIDTQHPQSFVYFITNGHFVKIGKANIPQQRLESLQTGNGIKLFYIALIPCRNEFDAEQLEHALHKIYQKDRESGEWFNIKNKLNIKRFHEQYNPSKYIQEPPITIEDYCAVT